MHISETYFPAPFFLRWRPRCVSLVAGEAVIAYLVHCRCRDSQILRMPATAAVEVRFVRHWSNVGRYGNRLHVHQGFELIRSNCNVQVLRKPITRDAIIAEVPGHSEDLFRQVEQSIKTLICRIVIFRSETAWLCVSYLT